MLVLLPEHNRELLHNVNNDVMMDNQSQVSCFHRLLAVVSYLLYILKSSIDPLI